MTQHSPLKCQSDHAMPKLKVRVGPYLTSNKTEVLPWASEVPGTAVTNDHKLGLRRQEPILSLSWEPESKTKVSAGLCSL